MCSFGLSKSKLVLPHNASYIRYRESIPKACIRKQSNLEEDKVSGNIDCNIRLYTAAT